MKKGWLRHLDFIVIDILAIEFSLAATFFYYYFFFHEDQVLLWQMAFLLPLTHLFLTIMFDTYNGILQRGYIKEMAAVLKLEFLNFSVLLFLFYFLRLMPTIKRPVLIVYFLFCILSTYIFRFAQKFYLKYRYKNTKYSTRFW